ncbi:BadF/BadG/BcrA/BcrD ATPase family protein [Gemmatimonas sp.]|jgi:glucosamine kinase|uniref:BadF/BadG/BcrA/BcrD ATPase family protein n=1 Tax=Gemmatimonas sp. TaxID=1962908 RepID=UPI0037BE2542
MSAGPLDPTPLVVGVDGGGSHTRVLLADAAGTLLARVEGPGSALRPGAEGAAADIIKALIQDALAKVERPETRPAVCVVGVAGAGQERAAQALWSALAKHRVADDVSVQADAVIAMDDAFGDSAGVLLVAGTGSVAYSKAPDGRLERCGGWGPNVGDEGSAHWLGRRALSVVTAAQDGREPETALTGAVLTALELETLDDLIPWAATATPATLALLAPVVAQVAGTGDLRANALISFCVEELALHVRTLARRCFTDERAAVPVALAGGLLSRGSLVRKRLEQRLKSAVPGATVRSDDVDAARGAVRRARRLLGVEV